MPRTAQTAVMMAPNCNEDELGTQLVHALFVEKRLAQVFGI